MLSYPERCSGFFLFSGRGGRWTGKTRTKDICGWRWNWQPGAGGGSRPTLWSGRWWSRAAGVLGRGFHQKAGGPHAEVYALAEAGEDAAGATIYVNLEPCCHSGRTPPCTKQIIAAGITRVVAAVEDPDPRVSSAGLRELAENGVQVTTGVLAEEARRLNEVFFKYITTGRPFVILKAAISLDGKIAARTGDSQWITGEESRRRAHELRREADAVVVGVQTVISDDPLLTVRLPATPGSGKEKQPLRLILDTRARIPSRQRW